MQILINLWPIQKWMRSQKSYQFISSSILIIYDARCLRQMLDVQNQNQNNSNNGDVSSLSLLFNYSSINNYKLLTLMTILPYKILGIKKNDKQLRYDGGGQ